MARLFTSDLRDDQWDELRGLIALVPTIAHMLGFDPPADSLGPVMCDPFRV